MRALLMAGGEGRRLRPLTNRIPKPLLKLGSRSIIEHALLLVRRYGITDVTLAVNYLAHLIEAYIGDGESLGMRISYQREDRPLGTAGALRELEDFRQTLLMMNGDVVTDLDLTQLMDSHRSSGAVMTVACKLSWKDLSLGLLDIGENGLVQAYREKPRVCYRFSAGIYIAEPRVKDFICPGERIDIPELINRLIDAGHRVASYDHDGKWIDIGAPEEYARAQADAQSEVQPNEAGAAIGT